MINTEDVVRGSIDIPLTEVGLAEAVADGEMFKQAGEVDIIVSSDMLRAQQTANLIALATKSKGESPLVIPASNLRSWAFGELEGQQKGPRVAKLIKTYLQNQDMVPPGRGAGSTTDGESFSQFSRRVLAILEELRYYVRTNPTEKVLAVTHLWVLEVLTVYGEEGARWPHINNTELLQSDRYANEDPPASIHYWDEEKGKVTTPWGLGKPGLYIVRHGMTELNANIY
jgi:broad specificity phosphatase PhoE